MRRIPLLAFQHADTNTAKNVVFESVFFFQLMILGVCAGNAAWGLEKQGYDFDNYLRGKYTVKHILRLQESVLTLPTFKGMSHVTLSYAFLILMLQKLYFCWVYVQTTKSYFISCKMLGSV